MLLCVFVYRVNTQTRRLFFFFFLHVLLTLVILLHTAMETEFGIQMSLLSEGTCMSVSDFKLFCVVVVVVCVCVRVGMGGGLFLSVP